MNRNVVGRNADQILQVAASEILASGLEISSRAGRVKEITHVGMSIERPWEREILNPERKVNLAAQIAETMWVLAGRDDVEWLSLYLPRAKDFSDNGKVWRGGYGPRLREWGAHELSDGVDQLRHVVELMKKDRSTRRAVISIYDPEIDTKDGKDIPCNNWLSFISREGSLDLSVSIRSNDLIWGWSGINQFEWSVLQEIVAFYLGVKIGRLHFNQTSLHIYDKHWEKADKITKAHFSSQDVHVRFEPPTREFGDFDGLVSAWFELEEQIRRSPRAVDVESFPEPMLRSWLRVLQWWWSGDEEYLAVLEGSSLWQAAKVAVQPIDGSAVHHSTPKVSPFLKVVTDLHNEKHEAYGDSWKRRGERVAIQANIARKVDRLGGAETSDETSADTAIDLFVYLAKYHTWLNDQSWPLNNAEHKSSDDPEEANHVMAKVEEKTRAQNWTALHNDALIVSIKNAFERLLEIPDGPTPYKFETVDYMMVRAYVLARRLWAGLDEYKGADHE